MLIWSRKWGKKIIKLDLLGSVTTKCEIYERIRENRLRWKSYKSKIQQTIREEMEKNRNKKISQALK